MTENWIFSYYNSFEDYEKLNICLYKLDVALGPLCRPKPTQVKSYGTHAAKISV